MEASVEGAGERGQELRGPGTAVAAIGWETLIDLKGGACGNGDQELLAAHSLEVVVVLDAVEAVAVGYLILADEYLVGALERPGNDEVAALVVECGQNDGGRGGLFYGLKLGTLGCLADGVDYGDRLFGGGGLCAGWVRARGGVLAFGGRWGLDCQSLVDVGGFGV